MSCKIKELLIFGKDEKIKNRQYNNKTLIIFLENNEAKTKDKEAYFELVKFLNESVENELFKFCKNKEKWKILIKIRNAYYLINTLKMKQVFLFWKIMDLLKFWKININKIFMEKF